jgi:hypothetical protein
VDKCGHTEWSLSPSPSGSRRRLLSEPGMEVEWPSSLMSTRGPVRKSSSGAARWWMWPSFEPLLRRQPE